MENDVYAFYGLTNASFGPAANPSPPIQLATRTALINGIVTAAMTHRAVLTIGGEPGVGKSTLMRMLATQCQKYDLLVAQITRDTHDVLSVQQRIGEALGIEADALAGPQPLVAALQGRGPVIVIVDDADALAEEGWHYLWFLQRLCNAEATRLQIVLIGGLGRWAGLEDPRLAEFRQMAGWRTMIQPLAEDEAELYLDHKLRHAGQSMRRLMTRAVAAELLEQAYGIPAQIDALMECLLERGYLTGQRLITVPTLRQALFNEMGPVDSPAVHAPPQRVPVRWRATIVAALATAVVAGAIMFAEAPGSHDRHNAEPDLPSARADTTPDAAILAPEAEPPLADARPLADPQPAIAQTQVAGLAAPQVGHDGGPGLAVLAKAGDTMQGLYGKVYRGLTPPPYAAVAAVNHTPFRPGAIVIFPAPPDGWNRH